MILIIMGVSGSGKSTVGRAVAARLGCGFSDADDFHSAANKAKMAAGIPLEDADREPWLQALREAIDAWQAAAADCVLACSALKSRYREMLGASDANRKFIYLKGSYELFRSRLEGRTGHFFDPELLRSQFEALEEPTDAIVVDAAQSVEAQVGEIIASIAR
jgi:gluconokinase